VYNKEMKKMNTKLQFFCCSRTQIVSINPA
jgi:hypothetical protein